MKPQGEGIKPLIKYVYATDGSLLHLYIQRGLYVRCTQHWFLSGAKNNTFPVKCTTKDTMSYQNKTKIQRLLVKP